MQGQKYTRSAQGMKGFVVVVVFFAVRFSEVESAKQLTYRKGFVLKFNAKSIAKQHFVVLNISFIFAKVFKEANDN